MKDVSKADQWRKIVMDNQSSHANNISLVVRQGIVCTIDALIERTLSNTIRGSFSYKEFAMNSSLPFTQPYSYTSIASNLFMKNLSEELRVQLGLTKLTLTRNTAEFVSIDNPVIHFEAEL